VSRYQKGKTNLDFTEVRDSEWQWHQLGHMQVSTSLQTDNHANTPPLRFLQAGCPSCHPTNSVKALKAIQSTEGKRRHLEFPSTPCSIKISYRLTELLPGVWCLPFYRDTVYYDPQHLPCSIYVLDSPFLQPLSKSNRHKFKNCSHLCMHQCAYTAQSSYHYLPS